MLYIVLSFLLFIVVCYCSLLLWSILVSILVVYLYSIWKVVWVAVDEMEAHDIEDGSWQYQEELVGSD